MSIERRVELVENLFRQLEEESTQFAQTTGIKCISGCGKCCSYPNIEASPLEFLPWAFYLFLNGIAESTLTRLNETQSPICSIYKSLAIVDQGRCSSYEYRGLICRLFGFAASADKYGSLRLSTCKTIKDSQPDKYNSANDAISAGLPIPLYTEYYMQLNQIDFHLGNTVLPINKAQKMAIEEVLQYYAYRTHPDAERKCS